MKGKTRHDKTINMFFFKSATSAFIYSSFLLIVAVVVVLPTGQHGVIGQLQQRRRGQRGQGGYAQYDVQENLFGSLGSVRSETETNGKGKGGGQKKSAKSPMPSSIPSSVPSVSSTPSLSTIPSMVPSVSSKPSVSVSPSSGEASSEPSSSPVVPGFCDESTCNMLSDALDMIMKEIQELKTLTTAQQVEINALNTTVTAQQAEINALNTTVEAIDMCVDYHSTDQVCTFSTDHFETRILGFDLEISSMNATSIVSTGPVVVDATSTLDITSGGSATLTTGMGGTFTAEIGGDTFWRPDGIFSVLAEGQIALSHNDAGNATLKRVLIGNRDEAMNTQAVVVGSTGSTNVESGKSFTVEAEENVIHRTQTGAFSVLAGGAIALSHNDVAAMGANKVITIGNRVGKENTLLTQITTNNNIELTTGKNVRLTAGADTVIKNTGNFQVRAGAKIRLNHEAEPATSMKDIEIGDRSGFVNTNDIFIKTQNDIIVNTKSEFKTVCMTLNDASCT